MHPLLRVSALVAALSVTCRIAAAAESLLDPPPGFRHGVLLELDPTADFALQVGGLCYDPEGRPVIYESGAVKRLGDRSVEVLARFDPAVFGDFLVLAPDGRSVVFGESLEGNIYSVALDGSGATVLGNIASNFDLDFAPAAAPEAIRGRMFVSALGTGDNPDNAIYLLDPAAETPVDEVVTLIPTFSGPLAFDDAGNLFYVTATFVEAPSLVRFTPAQLAGGIGEGAVDFTDAEVLLSDLTGAFNLLWHREKLYLTDLGLSTGIGAIEVVDTRRNFLVSTFATVPLSQGIASPTFLAIHPGSEDFAARAGPEGGKMLVHYNDFATVSHVVEVTPRAAFVRGELNGDGAIDLSDGVFLLSWLFLGGPDPENLEAADINADGTLDIADAIFLFEFLFKGGAGIPE